MRQIRFVDKRPFAAPPVGPGREVDLLSDVSLGTPPDRRKLACKRRIIEGMGIECDKLRNLFSDVIEAYLPLTGEDSDG